MAVKTVYLAFIWSLIVLISANDGTHSYNSPEVCGDATYRKEIPVCSSEREERRLNVNLDCNQTMVSVSFNDPNLNVDDISRKEVRLSCSGLDNNQSVTNCSATRTGYGAEYNDKVIFYNLTEAGIHPGSTCTISGCFKEDGGPYFRAQTSTCTLPTVPTTTAQQTTVPSTTMATTTMPTTTMATTTMPTTTMPTTTMASTTSDTFTSDTFTSDPVTSGSTNSSHATTENKGPDPTSAIVAALIVLFATLSLITIIIIYVVWMKKRRYRKMALSFGDKKIMIFDPTYTPPVSIDKPAKNYYSHRLSFISLDLHHYLQPYGEFTTDFYGSQKLKGDSEYKDHVDDGDSVTIEVDKCSMESTRESSRSVLPHSSLIGPQTLKEAMVTIHKHAMTSTGSCGYVLDEVTTPTHNWSTTTTDNLSELTLKSGAVSNYITGAQYGDVLCTTEQEQDQELGEDTLSILLAEDTPESTSVVGDINLDQPQSSHDSEYVQSNAAASNALSAFPNESPFELDLEETEEESYNGDGHQNLTSVSPSTRFETTGYLDSNLLTQSFEPSVAIPEQEKLIEHQTGNPLTHLTNTEGYVQDTETPPPSYADNESLDLTFDTDSGNDLTFEPKQQGEEELPSHHHDNTTPDLKVDNTCDLDTPHASPPSITTPGYVRCEDIITNELPTREIVVPAGLISPSEAAESANFTVHLDFDEGMKSHPNPVELTSGRSNPGMNKVMYKLSTSQPNKQPWQLSEDDTTTFARAIAKEHYVSYDIVSSAEELSLNYSPDDPDPMWVSTNTSTTLSPTVNTQHLSNYYPPSDVSSGYLSASSTTGDANSYL